jgi:DNA-binding IclR family transcriptional regulator
VEKQGIDKLIDALKDGKWHSIEQIVQKTGIEKPKAKLVIAFLEQFQFIERDKRKIKLNPLTKQLLEKLEDSDNASSFYEEMIA